MLLSNPMSVERPHRRFLSSLVAFSVATAPLLGVYLGIVANIDIQWWLGATLVLGTCIGLLYSRQGYSVSHLWNFTWGVWKGLAIAYVANAVLFRIDFADVAGFGLQGRLFFGGLVFVVFAVIYGASYLNVYTESV